jgi:hypothetical protein
MDLAWALADIPTPANFCMAVTAVGYVVFEFLRAKC